MLYQFLRNHRWWALIGSCKFGTPKRDSGARRSRSAYRLAVERLETRALPSATVWGDFNGDGFADRATGLPTASVNSQSNAGQVRIDYGTAGGLDTANPQFLNQNDAHQANTAKAGDEFGFDLAAGDFNNDGLTDLAVGVPFDNVGGASRAGLADVFYGSRGARLGSGRIQEWNSNSPGIVHRSAQNDLFGTTVAAGDFNGDGYADLAIGVINNSGGPLNTLRLGQLQIIYGGANGLGAKNNRSFDPGTSGILGDCQLAEHFGSALAVGDFNGDGFADIAVSSPFKDGNFTDVGSVNVLYGSANGLTATGNQLFAELNSGVAQAQQVGVQAAAGARFGSGLSALDVNGDGITDLVIQDAAGHSVTLFGSHNRLHA